MEHGLWSLSHTFGKSTPDETHDLLALFDRWQQLRNQKSPVRGLFVGCLAEAVRFELTDLFKSPVFKTGAIDHSATLPWG